MSDGSLDISEILREVRDELRENNKRLAEIKNQTADIRWKAELEEVAEYIA